MARSGYRRRPRSGVALIRIGIIGSGRAGRSFAGAFESVGLSVELCGRDDPITGLTSNCDAVLIATPDSSIGEVASVLPVGSAVVLHCSGVSTLDVLGDHHRRASIHPLMSLPDAERGRARLLGGGWFAVAGDPLAAELVERLGGRCFAVDERARALYHATASISANHLVALLGQVERLAADLDVPVEPFFELARGSFDDVVARGAAEALTGPAARGDEATIERHRAAIPGDELALYDQLVAAARRLAGHAVEPQKGDRGAADLDDR